MKVYSPSETETYRRCPTLWALQKSGWRTDMVGYPNVAAAVGVGVHHGAALLHKRVKEEKFPMFPAMFADEKVSTAVAEGHAQIESLLEKGAFPVEKVEDWRDRIEQQVSAGVRAYIHEFPKWFCKEWDLLAYEESYGASRGETDYAGRLDLLYRDERGLVLADIKTKQPFKTDYYREMFIQQMEWSWQLYSYAHMVWNHTGKFPYRFQLIMIELAARPKITHHWYRFNQEYYKRWHYSASKLWDEMVEIESGLAIPAISDTHMFFGAPCPFKRACLDYGCDEDLMKNNGYIQIENEDD